MTHGERMARAALAMWLRQYEAQQRCEHCAIMNGQCGKHMRRADEMNQLADKTRRLLASGPN